MLVIYVSMLALECEFMSNIFFFGYMSNLFCLVQLMALLLLRHALSVTDSDGDDDPSTFFSVSDTSSFWLSSLCCCCFTDS